MKKKTSLLNDCFYGSKYKVKEQNKWLMES